MSRRYGPGDRWPRHDPRLEQDMDAILEADVEYFDHPTLGRIRIRDHLVLGEPVCSYEGDIEAEQLTDEFP